MIRDRIKEFRRVPAGALLDQSAGAQSVLALFAAPEARGLFHMGIAQSPYAIPDHGRWKALSLGADLRLGRSTTSTCSRCAGPSMRKQSGTNEQTEKSEKKT